MAVTRPIPALVWPGKTRRCCRAVRPLLLREYHGQAPAEPPSANDAAPAAGPLLPNLLVRADNRLLLSSLLHGPLRRVIDARGGIRLAYMDPPFAVGTDFTMPVAREGRISAVAYSDIWPGGLAGFLNMMHERLLLLRELLPVIAVALLELFQLRLEPGILGCAFLL
jgi:hypothetical protein